MKPVDVISHGTAGYQKIPVKTVYLEMRRNMVPHPPQPPPGCAIRRWRRPPVEGYRRLFSAVGGKWGWSGRRIMNNAELKKIIHAQTSEIFLLKRDSETAGFIELDRRVPGQAEIVYFGLLPEFIGRGLGGYLLNWAIHRAWEGKPKRIWLHTCQYDHPRALAVYLKAGFNAYDEKIEMQPYPVNFLLKSNPPGG